MKNNSDHILALATHNLSLIPIAEGKKSPHTIIGKHSLLVQSATTDEVQRWLTAGVSSWALANGAVSSNLVTLDFDEKHYQGLYDLWEKKLSADQKQIIDHCYRNGTRNNGTHIRYRTQSSQPTVKLAHRLEWNEELQKAESVTIAEVRGEGSYALIPPSQGYTTLQGDLLDLPLVSDEMHEEFIDLLRVFNEVEDEPVATEYENSTANSSSGLPGNRYNKEATWHEILVPHGWTEEGKNQWRRPGKKDGEGISATTDFDNRPILYVFSSSALPFKQNKGYSKFAAYTLLNHGGDFKAAAKAVAVIYPHAEEKKPKSSQSNFLLDLIIKKDSTTLFHDERKTPYIALDVNGHQEIWPCKSSNLSNWLSSKYWIAEGKAASSETIKNTLSVIEANAQFNGEEFRLNNRFAWYNKELFYDLTNKKWQAIKINESGWQLVDELPIIFKRYSHHNAQVMPAENGNARLILNYVNITNDHHRLLLMVFMVSCFIPDFAHVILVVSGSQGSAKTTLSKMLRQIIDPSFIDTASFPRTHVELVQALDHHAFIFFDNVSNISADTSDTLCKAVTGSGFIKRQLYENDEDIIFNFKRCIGINGINIVTTRPDLLERSLLLDLERIEPTARKEENELWKNFNQDLPIILGGIFDALVKTLEIKPTIKLASSPRMADFAAWGCAIAQALGYSQEDFLGAYQENIDQQSEIVINENIVAMAVLEFMKDKNEWKGTATALLQAIDALGFLQGIDTYEQHWPRSSGAFTRKLNSLQVNLKEVGIIYSTTKGLTREIALKKIQKKEDQAPIVNPLPFQAEDGTTDAMTQ